MYAPCSRQEFEQSFNAAQICILQFCLFAIHKFQKHCIFVLTYWNHKQRSTSCTGGTQTLSQVKCHKCPLVTHLLIPGTRYQVLIWFSSQITPIAEDARDAEKSTLSALGWLHGKHDCYDHPLAAVLLRPAACEPQFQTSLFCSCLGLPKYICVGCSISCPCPIQRLWFCFMM